MSDRLQITSEIYDEIGCTTNSMDNGSMYTINL